MTTFVSLAFGHSGAAIRFWWREIHRLAVASLVDGGRGAATSRLVAQARSRFGAALTKIPGGGGRGRRVAGSVGGGIADRAGEMTGARTVAMTHIATGIPAKPIGSRVMRVGRSTHWSKTAANPAALHAVSRRARRSCSSHLRCRRLSVAARRRRRRIYRGSQLFRPTQPVARVADALAGGPRRHAFGHIEQNWPDIRLKSMRKALPAPSL